MSNKNKFKLTKKEDGLSMLELLVTISILLSVIMVILVVGDRSISQANLFATQTQATFLAKEAVEIISEDNNKNTIRDGTFDTNISNFWNVDYNTGVINVALANCKNNLRVNDGFYNHSTGESSPFSRCIVSEIIENKHLAITTDVYFNHKGEEQSITLYRIFYFNE